MKWTITIEMGDYAADLVLYANDVQDMGAAEFDGRVRQLICVDGRAMYLDGDSITISCD